ncbi:MAG: hypothetical protein P8X64_14770, partial [Anaerolineales bacterium]
SIPEPGGEVAILDWRWDSRPDLKVAELQLDAQVQIWSEGRPDDQVGGKPGSELEPAATLVVWTAPADRRNLLDALERVQPRQLIVVALEPNYTRFEDYVRHLAGLVKFALRKQEGCFNLLHAAENLGSVRSTVKTGLEYLAARGLVTLEDDLSGTVLLTAGKGDTIEVEGCAEELRHSLLEAAAFRGFLKKCDLNKLLLN